MPLALPFQTSTKKIAVLGGGITGLAAAFRLARLGHSVRLFEQSGRLGGMIRTEMTDGWLVEGGPQTIRETSPLIPLLMNTVGLKKARIEAAPEARNRYIVRRGKLVPLPTTPGGMVFSKLLSPWGKLRLAMEPLRRRKSQMPDRSFAEFIRQHCGQEVVDYIAKPIATGIYAGDADLLSARHAFPKIWDMEHMHGSFLRAQEAHVLKCRKRSENVVPTTFSFRRGMQTLTHGYVLALPADVITLNARVEGLVPGPRWHVIWRDIGGQNLPADQDWSQTDDTGRQVEGFDAVICALPGSAMARLEFGERNVRPMAELREVPHASVASLFLGYRRDQVAHPLDGFGLLVPPKEKRSFLGVTFSSSVFPGRAPDGHVALTVMAGGVLQPEMAALSAADLLAAVKPDLQSLLGAKGEPVFQRHTAWPRAIPQYNLGHPRFNKVMSQCEKDHPGFFIAGHARHGISVANCICSGEDMAERAAVHGNSW
jgi:oxygen-dependent protoporphyrinogen oxidase